MSISRWMDKKAVVHIHFFYNIWIYGGSEVKASDCNTGDLGLIHGSGRSLGEENGNLLQYSCLETPMDGGAWWATVHGAAKSQTRLSKFTFTFRWWRKNRKRLFQFYRKTSKAIHSMNKHQHSNSKNCCYNFTNKIELWNRLAAITVI